MAKLQSVEKRRLADYQLGSKRARYITRRFLFFGRARVDLANDQQAHSRAYESFAVIVHARRARCTNAIPIIGTTESVRFAMLREAPRRALTKRHKISRSPTKRCQSGAHHQRLTVSERRAPNAPSITCQTMFSRRLLGCCPSRCVIAHTVAVSSDKDSRQQTTQTELARWACASKRNRRLADYVWHLLPHTISVAPLDLRTAMLKFIIQHLRGAFLTQKPLPANCCRARAPRVIGGCFY